MAYVGKSSKSWTPVLQFGGASTGITYAAQTGSYFQIGPVVFFDCVLILTSKGTATGQATITGLPTAHPVTFCSTPLRFNKLTYTDYVCAFMNSSSTTLFIDQIPSSGSPSELSDTAFADDSYVELSGSYIVG